MKMKKQDKEKQLRKLNTWSQHSLRFKIAIIVACSTLLTIALAWGISNVLIRRFYVANTKSTLIETYNNCNDFFNVEENVEQLQNSDIGSLYGYIENPAAAAIFVIDTTNMRVYTSVNTNSKVNLAIQSAVLSFDFNKFKDKKVKYEIRENVIDDKDNVSSDSDLFDNNNSFKNGSYFDLMGVLDNGDIIVLRTQFNKVHDDIAFVAKLFMYIAFWLVLLEALLILFISARYTNPIITMSKAAKKMCGLDFDVKIPVRTNDEIGQLATSMNEMSETLEKSISDLKSANLELSKNLEEKIHLEEMRSEFLSHVSHELKTPIALIQGYSEGLKDGIADNPEDMNYYLDVIMDEASKMNSLVMKLIDLNELEFGKDNLKIERFNITDLINQVALASKILLDQSETKFIFQETDAKYVWADEFLIEEVFTNYFTNAIHYVKQGGEIRVWYEQKENTVRINVMNEGNQIADKDIDKLFIKFYKADAARTREYGGSGIGLSIVAAIMKSHKKDFGVYNVEKGVVFYFELDTSIDTESLKAIEN